MIESNSSDEKTLDKYANIALSTTTYNKYKKKNGIDSKQNFLKKWFADKDGAGAKKVDSAMRIFESEEPVKYPYFLEEALCFD